MKNPFKLSLHVSLLLLFTVVTAVTAQTPTQSPEPSRGLGIPSNTTQRSSSEKNGPTTAKPELVLQTGHTKPVNAIAISPDGRWLASGSEDNTTKIWDLATGSVLRTLTGHTKRVYTVAISPDGRWLASGSEDDTVKLWDVNTGSEAHTLGGHSFPVSGVAFSPDSRRLVSVSRDSAKVWDVAAGSELRSFRISDKGDVEMVAVSPDARLVAAGGGWSSGGAFGIAGAFSVGASHKPIKLFDVATGREVAALKIGEKNALGDIAFSPDGRLLAARIRDQKGTIKLWDTAGGRQLQSLQSGDLYGTGAVAFSSDGRWLVSRNTGKPDDAAGVMIEIWEVTTGRSVRGLKLGGKYSALTLRDSKSDPIVFSPDGRILAAGKASAVKLWDVATWSELRTLETNDKAAPASPTASNPMLEALKSQGINVEDFNEMMKSALGAVEASGISGLGNAAFAFSPDGRWLFSENEPSGWWDIATGTKVRGPMPTGQASFGNGTFGHSAFSPDGRLFAALERDSSGGATISIRETGTWREVRTIPLGNQSAPNFAFGPDGRWLSLMSTNMKGAISIKLFDISSGNELRTFQTDNRYGMGNVIFSPDGRFMISEGVDLGGGFGRGFGLGGLKGSLKGSFPGLGRDATPTIPGQEYKIKLWDVESGRQLRALNTTAAYTSMPATTFSRDGSMMAVAGYKNNAATIHIYRLPSGTEVSTLNTGGQNSAITVLSFSPDGRILAMAGREPRSALAQRRKASQSASPDNVVTLWEVGSGRKILTLAHTGGVNGVANSYANSQYNLKYAVADAQAFGKEVAQEQAQMGHYAHVEVIPLVDQDATKANILTALKRLAGGEQEALPAGALAVWQKLRAAQPEDAVIIYYAGHGTAQQQRFYLIPYDLGYTGERTRLDANGLQTILAHSISDEELQQALEGVDAGQLLLVIDACNSGQALEAEEKRRGPMNSKGLAQLAYEKGMYILTAAQGYQAALEAAQLGHGYLTYALVEEGLKSSAADNEPKDGVVTVREWFDYATERVPQMQQEKMEQGRGVGINISFVEGEEAVKEPEKRSIQRPRAFYCRELEGNSLIVAKTAANQPEE